MNREQPARQSQSRRPSGTRTRTPTSTTNIATRRICTLREGPPHEFAPTVAGERLRLIRMNQDKWVNGTLLRYGFFENTGQFAKWAGTTALKAQVRRAFKRWTDLGIGLRFEEAADRGQAGVRIGFEAGDGHWSYVGRQVHNQGPDDRTMNLDPDDGIASGDYGVDVACHEIGHTMGFPHEHQNPNAGIVWDEEAVYRTLAGAPNFWPREVTFHNIIRKIPADQVQGSSWDPNSIMHYSFEPGLILKPEQYHVGLRPAGGLSARDTGVGQNLLSAPRGRRRGRAATARVSSPGDRPGPTAKFSAQTLDVAVLRDAHIRSLRHRGGSARTHRHWRGLCHG